MADWNDEYTDNSLATGTLVSPRTRKFAPHTFVEEEPKLKNHPVDKWTFVFHLDINRVLNPETTKGAWFVPFVTRVMAASEEGAIKFVIDHFGNPLILAAFEGWPKSVRGEEIFSLENVKNRYKKLVDMPQER